MSEQSFVLNGVRCPWDGRYWIGLALDSIVRYLKWEGKGVYYLMKDCCPLDEAKSAVIVNNTTGDRICVTQDEKDACKYHTSGFPVGEKFNLFRESVQDIFDLYMKEISGKSDERKAPSGLEVAAKT